LFQIPERFSVRILSCYDIILAALIAFVLFLSTLIASGIGQLPEQDDGNAYLYGNTFIGLAVSCLIAPIIEEVLFRETIPRLLARRFPAGFAVLASAVAFATIHIGYGWSAWMVLCVGAVLLSVSYSKSENLLVPILTHCMLNTAISAYDGFG